MGLQYSITAIGSVMIQTAVNGLGTAYVTAVTAATKVSMFFCCPFDAMGCTNQKRQACPGRHLKNPRHRSKGRKAHALNHKPDDIHQRQREVKQHVGEQILPRQVTAATKVSMFFCCPFDAMGCTMATYGGQNAGAAQWDRLHQGIRAPTKMVRI